MDNCKIAALSVFGLFVAWGAVAQSFDADAAEQLLAKPIALVEDETQGDADLEAFDPVISYYVQSLNLSPEQLAKAQQISEAGQAKKEELLRQIEALRREAYALEAGSLIAFEAILSDDQRVAFHELQANGENENTSQNDGK